MKILIIVLSLYALPVVALDGSTTPQGSTQQPSSTGIMGGGTPGRSDSSQMSKQMYGQEDAVRKGEEIQKEEEKAKKDKSMKRKKGTTKD